MPIGQDAQELVVAGSGNIYVADFGTALPAEYDDVLNAAFADLGYATEDGMTVSWSPDIERFRAWQSRHAVRVSLTGAVFAASFELEQWNEETLKAAFGGGDVTTVSPGSYRYDFIADDEQLREVSLVGDWIDGDRRFRWVVPKAVMVNDVEAKASRSELSLLPVGLEAIKGADEIAYLLSNDAAIGTGS